MMLTLVNGSSRAQSAGCTPVEIDDTVADLHMDRNRYRLEFQDSAEMRRLYERFHGAGITPTEISVFEVEVDTTGKTTDVKTISGMPELSHAYADMVRRASYIPFKRNGKPVCVKFIAKIGPPEYRTASWDRFHSLLQRCTDLLRSGASAAELISSCQAAADAGDALPSSSLAVDKRLAYVTTATAMMRANRAKDALPYAEEAVQTADEGWDDIDGKASAYGVRGQARALTGDMKGAIADLTKAEALERATFEVKRKPEQKAFDTHALKSMLGFHAEVLTAMHEKAEADKLRDEAKKL